MIFIFQRTKILKDASIDGNVDVILQRIENLYNTNLTNMQKQQLNTLKTLVRDSHKKYSDKLEKYRNFEVSTSHMKKEVRFFNILINGINKGLDEEFSNCEEKG